MTTPNAPPRRTHIHRLLLIFLLVLALAGAAWIARPDGRLYVYFLDTSGDAVLIQTPRGGYVLIDGGTDPALLALHLGRKLPFWQRNLDAVVLTRSDHARLPGQVAALARYRARVALAPPGAEVATQSGRRTSGTSVINNLQAEWSRLLNEQATPIRIARPGDRLQLGGTTLTVLAAGSGRAGLVLRLDYGSTSVGLAGAGGEANDEQLLADAQPLTALAYPWQRELDTPLVAAWQPQAIIFTRGWEADDPALLTTAERALHGAAVYHNAIHGTVELISDGRRAWIVTEK